MATTREQAEKLVDDLIDAVRATEQERHYGGGGLRYYQASERGEREAVIVVLMGETID